MGAILFELLTGRPPYSGANHLQLLRNIQRSEAALPPALQHSLSPACRTLLAGLLQRDPVARISFPEFFGHDFLVAAPGSPGTSLRGSGGAAEQVQQTGAPQAPNGGHSSAARGSVVGWDPLPVATGPPPGALAPQLSAAILSASPSQAGMAAAAAQRNSRAHAGPRSGDPPVGPPVTSSTSAPKPHDSCGLDDDEDYEFVMVSTHESHSARSSGYSAGAAHPALELFAGPCNGPLGGAASALATPSPPSTVAASGVAEAQGGAGPGGDAAALSANVACISVRMAERATASGESATALALHLFALRLGAPLLRAGSAPAELRAALAAAAAALPALAADKSMNGGAQQALPSAAHVLYQNAVASCRVAALDDLLGVSCTARGDFGDGVSVFSFLLAAAETASHGLYLSEAHPLRKCTAWLQRLLS